MNSFPMNQQTPMVMLMGKIDIYNANLCNEQFLFYEMRIVAKLMLEGLSDEEIIAKVREENLFQKPTERKLVELSRNCLRRLNCLDNQSLVEAIADGPVDAAKQINLYGMMRSNRLVWDFMTTVLGEKFRTQDFVFEAKDLNLFLMRLCEQNDVVAAWSENTLSKIKQVLKKSIFECGFLDSVRTTKLNPVYPYDELIEGIKENGDFDALAAFNYFG